MKNQILLKEVIRKIRYFPVLLPVVFALFFFGLMPVKYDAVMHTQNIEGEGICTTAICNPCSFQPFYQTAFYFGSELEKATITGCQYNVDQLYLDISNVTTFEIPSLDAYVWGIHVKHYDGNQLLTSAETLDIGTAVITNTGEAFHVDVKDPDAGTAFNLNKQMIPALFWVVYGTVVVLATLLLSLLAALFIRRWPVIGRILMGISGTMAVVLAGQFFCGSMPFAEFPYFVLNWLFIYAFSVVVGALTMPWIGTAATMGLTLFCYIANYFVIALRGKPVMPADLKAMGTAAEVMGGYVFKPTWQMIAGSLAVILYAVGLSIAWRKSRQAQYASGTGTAGPSAKRRVIYRLAAIAAAVVVCVAGVNTTTFKNLNSFAWDVVLQKSFHQEGMVLTFLKSALNSRVKQPEGYSREQVDEYLSQYQSAAEADAADSAAAAEDVIRPTNIIMVMNEAFSDLRTVGLNDNVDVMPFIDSLQENTIEGRLHVPVYGGGTCNTEFEALTGNTLAFLSAGAYPYTENITDEMFSLASYFRDQGYLTEAFHAHDPQNWNRDMVYPNLGFDKFNSFNDYYEALGDVPYLHGHPADTADYAFIEKVDEENQAQPRFLFNVTMQNHSGYEKWEDVEEAESVAENAPGLYQDTRTYLSLVKASDDAVKQLVETYKDSDEPTMIIFFGDHQPGLPDAAQSEIYTETDTFLDWYMSKFFIWTNYESEAMHDVDISANYLPYLILKQGNFEMPPYVQMLGELYKKYPVFSAMGVIDAEENIYASVSDVLEDPLVQKYQEVQYANMFDKIDDAWFKVK